MTVKCNILSPSGSCDDLVQMLLESNHVPAVVDLEYEFDDITDMIVITSELDDYAWIMLGHWQMFTRDYPEQYTAWVNQHYCGRGHPEHVEELTADDWAEHVAASYGHIGQFAPLNNSLQDLTRNVKNSPKTHELRLQDLLTDPEGTLTKISLWTGASLAEASRTQFLEHVAQRRADRKEWTERVQVLRPSTRVY